MNDNEIINNFKIIVYDFRENCGVKTYEVLKATFDLINRQREEIERLKEENENLRDSIVKKKFKDEMFEMTLGEYKAEAYKELADRLKMQTKGMLGELFIKKQVDNLVKEMTEQTILTNIEHNSLCETETYKAGENK